MQAQLMYNSTMEPQPQDNDPAHASVWPPPPSTVTPPIEAPNRDARDRQYGAYLGAFVGMLSVVLALMTAGLHQGSSLQTLERMMTPAPIHALIGYALARRRPVYGVAFAAAAIGAMLLIFLIGLYMIKSEL